MESPPLSSPLACGGARHRIALFAGGASLLVFAACASLFLAAGGKQARPYRPVSTRPPPVVPPPSDPKALLPLTPDKAVAWNAAIPLSTLPNPPALPFKLGKRPPEDVTRSLDCLTAAIYYEAASESDDGERAVAQVVLNRVRHPAFPHTVCGVVFQGFERLTGCQFTFSCDGALARRVSRVGWDRAHAIATQALGGAVYPAIGWATHYHTQWVVPYWSNTLVKTAQVGAHIFYRWEGGWGTRRAFTAGYDTAEPVLTLAFGLRANGAAVPVGAPAAIARDERPVLQNETGRPQSVVDAAAPRRDVGAVERPVLAGP